MRLCFLLNHVKISWAMTARAVLSKYGKLHTLAKGTVLFSQGDPITHVSFLLDGAVKLYRLNEEGRNVNYRIVAPNEFISIKSVFGSAEHESYAETLMSSQILTVKADVVEKLLDEDASFRDDVMQEVVRLWTVMTEKLVGILTQDSVGRVAFVLYRICILFNLVEKKGPAQIPFAFTHEDMAGTTGLLRETVTLSMLLLQEKGIIIYRRGRITVRNRNLLERCAKVGKKALFALA